jgi:geranylgeranyl diphosphate synthase type I
MLDYKNNVEEELKKFFARKKHETSSLSKELGESLSKLEDFTMRGGKRIRAVLMIVGYTACGGKDLKEIIKTSISAELIHSFLLIHDDIIDNDDFRRNGPTVHKSYGKMYSPKLAEAIAIIVGDYSGYYALDLIINSRFDDKNKLEALNEIINAIKETCYGEFIDVLGSVKEVDEKEIQKIHLYKTAKYTFSYPLRAGAMLAGANKQVLKQFNNIGILLGLAFQVKDDILGIYGDEKEVGKPIGSDIREGKKTLLVLKANSPYVKSKLGKKISLSELEKIRKIIKDSGSLAYSQDLISTLISKAKKEISKLKVRQKEKSFLIKMADYVAERSK